MLGSLWRFSAEPRGQGGSGARARGTETGGEGARRSRPTAVGGLRGAVKGFGVGRCGGGGKKQPQPHELGSGAGGVFGVEEWCRQSRWCSDAGRRSGRQAGRQLCDDAHAADAAVRTRALGDLLGFVSGCIRHGGLRRWRPDGWGEELLSGAVEVGTAARAEEPVGPDLHETPRQHVLHEAADELGCVEPAAPHLAGAILAVAEDDVLAVEVLDAAR